MSVEEVLKDKSVNGSVGGPNLLAATTANACDPADQSYVLSNVVRLLLSRANRLILIFRVSVTAALALLLRARILCEHIIWKTRPLKCMSIFAEACSWLTLLLSMKRCVGDDDRFAEAL
jgi:hypothetical protein